MSIESRAKLLIDELKVSQKELEKLSGISQQVWSKAFNGRQRLNSTHIEFLCSEYSDYALWLTTGNTDLGLSPKGAQVLEHFNEVADLYSTVRAEIDYALMIKDYFEDTSAILDENGCAGGSPLPSSRMSLKESYYQSCLKEDLKEFLSRSNMVSEGDIKLEAKEFFRKKAEKEFVEVSNSLGEGERSTIMISRLYSVLLLPEATSNILYDN